MKRVLYISNIEVPYRTEFFNRLSKQCDLTVLYEREKSSNRDEDWTKSAEANYKIEYLSGINIKNEYTFDFSILKYVLSNKYDKVILGCYNSPSQMLAIVILKLFKKEYYLNIDGEYFIEGNSIKTKIKRFFIKGARAYLVAGEKAAENIKRITKSKNVYPYYFSSLTEQELKENSEKRNKNINDTILIIGQFFDYKGLDIAVEVAKKNKKLKYKFVGMGKRSDLFKAKVNEMNAEENIEIVPFLQKESLYKEYQECRMIVLPSKQECWGLVVNEAASFGTPIVSTKGSGAAIEFIKDEYPQFIAEPCNSEDLYKKIDNLINYKNINDYKNYLMNESKKYSIEHMVKIHANLINNR